MKKDNEMPKPKHNWEYLFSQESTDLRQGVDYPCSTSSMVQQIRNKASERGLSVSIIDMGYKIHVKVNETAFIGIDPGASGGIAFLFQGVNGVRIETHKIPKEVSELYSLLRDETKGMRTHCFIELVGGFMREDDNNKASAHTMFTFGRGFGRLEAVCIALGLDPYLCPPKEWQAGVNLPGKKRGEKQTAWKNRIKKRAMQIFPELKITLATADALCIAQHCFQERGNNEQQ